MRNLLRLKIGVLLMLFGSIALAQTRNVSGRVTSSEDGTPIPGVNVLVKGTTNGATTDAEGKFSLEVPNKSFHALSLLRNFARSLNKLRTICHRELKRCITNSPCTYRRWG